MTLKLVVPLPIGEQMVANTPSKGVGESRLFANNIKRLEDEIKDLDETKTNKYSQMTSALQDSARLVMQAWENAEVNTSTSLKNEPSSEGSLKEKPKFTYHDLTDKEVQRCTGFKSKYLMLA